MGFRLEQQIPYERDIQKDILTMLAAHPSVAWAHRMNTGAHVMEGKKGKQRFIRYGFKGMSDIIGQMKSGHYLAIEVKRPGNKPSDDQIQFIDIVKANGGVGGIAYSVDDALEILAG